MTYFSASNSTMGAAGAVCFAAAGRPESRPLVHVTPDSSAVDWIVYKPQARRLYVQLKSGDIYRYDEVPGDTVHELVASESAGKAFNRLIKDKFVGERVAKRGMTI
jgi:hypothetical protein